MQERIQKIISASGLMSRRAAEEAIQKGRVTVNGVPAQLGDRADTVLDRVLVDGKALPVQSSAVYVMLHKPKGYVTTMHDEKDRKDVSMLVADVGTRVYPIGRLDMYSEGLLLLTNDGELANRVMHPKNEVNKTYHTWVSGQDVGVAVEYMRQSMVLDGYETRPAQVDVLELFPGGALLSVTIHEGRNRQVRKMCEAVGLRVNRLKRVSEGGVELGDLPCGKWRFLTAEEIEELRNG